MEYQGTNNHMVLIDLKKFECTRGGHLDGETASRLLENIGIIVNKVGFTISASCVQLFFCLFVCFFVAF